LKELWLEQREHEINEKTQRDHAADDVEQWHQRLLQRLTQPDEKPREPEESDTHREVEKVTHLCASM